MCVLSQSQLGAAESTRIDGASDRRKSDGSDVIGIYPLLPDDTCRFLVFDFDDHEASPGTVWQEDVDALRQICSQNSVPCYMERSRSAAAHMSGCFFDAPILPSWRADLDQRCLLRARNPSI